MVKWQPTCFDTVSNCTIYLNLIRVDKREKKKTHTKNLSDALFFAHVFCIIAVIKYNITVCIRSELVNSTLLYYIAFFWLSLNFFMLGLPRSKILQ